MRALRRIRERRREQVSDELPRDGLRRPRARRTGCPYGVGGADRAGRGGLSDRDREILDPPTGTDWTGRRSPALSTSAATTRTLMHRLRETVERSLGAVLVARHARSGRGCAALRESLKDWDGEFTVLLRKRVSRHIESCTECSDDRRGWSTPRPCSARVRDLPRPDLVAAEDFGQGSAHMCVQWPWCACAELAGVDSGGLGVAAVALGLFVFWPSAEPARAPVVESGVVSDAVVKPVAVRPNSMALGFLPRVWALPSCRAAVAPGFRLLLLRFFSPVSPAAAEPVPASSDAGGLQPAAEARTRPRAGSGRRESPFRAPVTSGSPAALGCCGSCHCAECRNLCPGTG